MCDFNLVLNQNFDTETYLHINHPKSQKPVLEIIETLDMKASFKELYPVLRSYTYTWGEMKSIKTS